VVRHANATEVEFRLIATQEELEIVIADNGKGFIADPSCNGNALRNLPFPLSEIGGSYEIESTLGKGPTVRIVLRFSREPARGKISRMAYGLFPVVVQNTKAR